MRKIFGIILTLIACSLTGWAAPLTDQQQRILKMHQNNLNSVAELLKQHVDLIECSSDTSSEVKGEKLVPEVEGESEDLTAPLIEMINRCNAYVEKIQCTLENNDNDEYPTHLAQGKALVEGALQLSKTVMPAFDDEYLSGMKKTERE